MELHGSIRQGHRLLGHVAVLPTARERHRQAFGAQSTSRRAFTQRGEGCQRDRSPGGGLSARHAGERENLGDQRDRSGRCRFRGPAAC
jgi:hypothetical protein